MVKFEHRWRWRVGMVASGVALLLVSVGSGSAAPLVLPGPDLAGAWTAPFEEGGPITPRCTEAGERIICKPVGQAAAALPDGRIFYFNGIDGYENVQHAALTEASVELRNSRARVLDLRTGQPQWIVPTPEDGGGINPDVRHGNPGGASDPEGTAGVPGQPGDGLVGSTAGRIAPHQPENKPDDSAENDADMFCADMATLSDGRILIAGGTDWYNEPAVAERHSDGADIGLVEIAGVRSSRIFDPKTNTFSQTGDMKYARWYPTTVPLPDGNILVAGGVIKLVKSTQLSNVRRTETFNPTTNTWSENYTGPASETSLPLVPRLHLMPSGKVFYNGTGQGWSPAGQAADEAMYALQQFFDPKTSQWEIVGPAPLGARGTATEVLLPLEPPYDQATVLAFGGTLGPPPSGWLATPFSTLTRVDNRGTVTNEITGSLSHARWYASGVLLPDGTILAVNGADKDELIAPGVELPVHTPEVYDPRTGRWTAMAEQARDRTYHSSAILLADGRVLVGGHAPAGTLYGPSQNMGKPFTNNHSDPSFEVFSPPYLFRGARPVIRSTPAGIAWGETFSIHTPDASDVTSVVLMRLPSAQHTIDADQRAVVLPFTHEGDVLRAVAPPTGAVAPAGPYYLFVNKKSPKGPIPSVARIVFVGAKSDPSEADQPFPDAP